MAGLSRPSTSVIPAAKTWTDQHMTKPLASRIALVTGASRGIGYASGVRLPAPARMSWPSRARKGLEELDDEIRKDGGSATLVPQPHRFRRHRAAARRCMSAMASSTFSSAMPVSPPLLAARSYRTEAGNDVMASTSPRTSSSSAAWTRCSRSPTPAAPCSYSGAASKANAYRGPYAASKAALDTLVRSWANETVSTNCASTCNPPRSPHPHARQRVSRRRPDDAGYAGTGGGIHRADVRA